MNTLYGSYTKYMSLHQHQWTEISYGLVNMTSISPMVQLYSVCAKYGLLNHVNYWLDGGRVISKHSWKEIVYKAVYTREYSLWKCLCVLYPRCDIFSCVINDISLCIWWYLHICCQTVSDSFKIDDKGKCVTS